MKKNHHLNLLTLCVAWLILPFSATCSIGDGNDFQALVSRLDNAVASRNFQDARAVLDVIMPLMKDELKEAKKTLSSLKKEDSPSENPEEYASRLQRKTELYNDLRELVDSSPAALRVRAEAISRDIKEFIDLS